MRTAFVKTTEVLPTNLQSDSQFKTIGTVFLFERVENEKWFRIGKIKNSHLLTDQRKIRKKMAALFGRFCSDDPDEQIKSLN